ncbi:MAG: parallel beta-helix domain-containing protein, partial [Myxococcota bacterium]
YGLYPVKCTNVLMEDSEASNAADAGIYIGQSQNVILRDNTATANVAGIEIENTQFADVFDNTATGNTAGIVVFDLPGNPIVGRDVRIHDNTITGNNGVNFATPGSVVSQIPPGVGSFILASRRVEFFDNTYENNNTSDIAVLSGLAIESDPAAWAIPKDESVGSTDGLNLMETDDTLAFLNFRTEQILIRDNTFGPGGTSPSGTALQPIGALLTVIYGDEPVDSIIYDTLGETSFSATDAEGNSNDNVLCIDNNTGAEFGSINLQAQQMALDTDNPPVDFYRPAAPFAPFDCDALAAGPVEAVTLP